MKAARILNDIVGTRLGRVLFLVAAFLLLATIVDAGPAAAGRRAWAERRSPPSRSRWTRPSRGAGASASCFTCEAGR